MNWSANSSQKPEATASVAIKCAADQQPILDTHDGLSIDLSGRWKLIAILIFTLILTQRFTRGNICNAQVFIPRADHA